MSDKVLHFDPMDTALEDLDVFEELTGVSFDRFDWKGAGKGVTEMKAIYWLVMRQNEPEFTAAQLGKVKLRELTEVMEAVTKAKPDPTDAAGAGS
jgi:hypothetical protein